MPWTKLQIGGIEMPKDEHYWKYRVFHEPSASEGIGHPVPMEALFLSDETTDEYTEASEVKGAFFVLRPEHDHHARVAMAAYAYSCRKELPHLAADIIGMIEALEWEEETGQHRDDLPIDSDDRMEDEHLGSSAVSYLRDKIEDVQ